MNIQLLIVDPQNDFCDPNGSLFVAGANDDMSRLAKMVNRVGTKIDDIHVTMDSHRTIDVAHPIYWVDQHGNSPNPFTVITLNDVKNGVWNVRNLAWRGRALNYLEQLEQQGKYALCIWPVHCRIGSWGHQIFPELDAALAKWETNEFGLVDYCVKGTNPHTEHYSAVKAEVVDPNDPKTGMNTDLLDTLKEADLIPFAGEALSHCVKGTVEDIANFFGDENIKKFVLLEDASSSVTGFEANGDDFVKNMVAKGMQVSNTVDFLA